MFAALLVRATPSLVAGVLVAGALTAPVAVAAHTDAPRRATNPTGTAAGSQPNGAGNLKVRLASTADGRLRVSWKRPAPAGKLRKFVVRVGPNRKLNSRVHTYKVKARKQSITVDRAFGTAPTSGNYSFVRVTVYRKAGSHGSSPTKWIQAPVAAACTAAPQDRVTVGTFNVRTWAADARKGTGKYNWDVRGDHAVKEILDSGVRAIAIQEASGPSNAGFGPREQDEWIIDRLNRTDQTPGAHWVDALTDDDYRGRGLVGTRVFYDASRFVELAAGLQRIPDPKAADSLVPWVRLQATSRDQAPFILTSNHLRTGDKRGDFVIRGRQVQTLIGILRNLQAQYGGQVIMAGDLNSTANTKPFNNVQHALIAAGLYDSYATSRIANAKYSTSNNFSFPVRPTPGRRDYIMSLGPLQGSCGYVNRAYRTASRVASDHFLQVATLPLLPL